MRQMVYLGSFRPQALGEQNDLQVNQFATPTLVNETGPHRGVFAQVGIVIRGTNFNTLTGALDVSIDYAYDGATTPTAIRLFTWNGVLNTWHPEAIGAALSHSGDGSVQGDHLTLGLGITFRYAAICRVVCNAAPDSGTPRLASFTCFWAKAADVA